MALTACRQADCPTLRLGNRHRGGLAPRASDLSQAHPRSIVLIKGTNGIVHCGVRQAISGSIRLRNDVRPSRVSTSAPPTSMRHRHCAPPAVPPAPRLDSLNSFRGDGDRSRGSSCLVVETATALSDRRLILPVQAFAQVFSRLEVRNVPRRTRYRCSGSGIAADACTAKT